MKKDKVNGNEIKQTYEISSLSLDKHGLNWTLIIIFIIILLCVFVWSIFYNVISKFTIEELKSCFTYTTTYVAGLGTIPVIRGIMIFLGKLISNRL